MHHKHRNKLYALFSQTQQSIIYLEGAKVMYRYETDYEFASPSGVQLWYVSGVNEADWQRAILNIDLKEYHLFVPKRDARYTPFGMAMSKAWINTVPSILPITCTTWMNYPR